jgi:hypothetical protein
MPDDIFADLPPKARDLGPPVGRYRNRRDRSALVLAVLAGMGLVLAAMVATLGPRAVGGPGQPSEALDVAVLVLALVGLVWCVLGVVRVARAARSANVRGIAHCPGGLVCVLRRGALVVPWDEIDSVWDGGLRFRTRGGVEVVVPPSLEGLPVLTELVYRETFQRMAVCASAVILGGGTMQFGPIRATRTDVAAGRHGVAWADVGEVVAAWPRLAVFRKGERVPALNVPMRAVPNVHAFLALAERLREGGFGSITIGPAAAEPPSTDEE